MTSIEKIPYPKLDKCPFCGYGRPELTVDDNDVYIQCPKCKAKGPSDYCIDYDGDNRTLGAMVHAINKWNERNDEWVEPAPYDREKAKKMFEEMMARKPDADNPPHNTLDRSI